MTMTNSKTAATANMESSKKLLWIARACMIIALIGVSITSYYFHHPENRFITRSFDPQIDQTLFFSVPLFIIVLGSWFWPIEGGIIAMLYGGLSLFQIWSMSMLASPLTLIPAPLYALLYGVFIIGGILHLTSGLRLKKPLPKAETGESRRLRWAARITPFVAIAASIVLLTAIYPQYIIWVAVSILASIVAGIAWAWSAAGSILIILFCFWQLSIFMNCPDEIKVISFVLYGIFLAGGILHLVIAWRERKLHSS